MNETLILSDGAGLAGLGMGVVFVFLSVLVASIKLMSELMHYVQPMSKVVKPMSSLGDNKLKLDSELMVVVASAIHRHRKSMF